MNVELKEDILDKRRELERESDNIILWEIGSALEPSESSPIGETKEETEVYTNIENVIKGSETVLDLLKVFETHIHLYRNDEEYTADFETEMEDRPYETKPGMYEHVLQTALEEMEDEPRNHLYVENISRIIEIQERTPEKIKSQIQELSNKSDHSKELLQEIEESDQEIEHALRNQYQEYVTENPEKADKYHDTIKQLHQNMTETHPPK